MKWAAAKNQNRYLCVHRYRSGHLWYCDVDWSLCKRKLDTCGESNWKIKVIDKTESESAKACFALLSCAGFLKQFLFLTGNKSLSQQAARRSRWCWYRNYISNHRFLVVEQLRKADIDLECALRSLCVVVDRNLGCLRFVGQRGSSSKPIRAGLWQSNTSENAKHWPSFLSPATSNMVWTLAGFKSAPPRLVDWAAPSWFGLTESRRCCLWIDSNHYLNSE